MKLKFTRYILYPIFSLLIFSAGQDYSFAQAKIIIGNTSPVFINISGGTLATPIYLVVDNSSTTAIDYSNVTPILSRVSWIISEGQYNKIQWNIGATNGTYIVPFGYSTTNALPYVFVKNAGNANIAFSTWATPNTNVPFANTSDVAAVTNMYDYTLAASGAIPAVIDRWWDTNPTSIVTPVTTTQVLYSYRGFENTMNAGYQLAEIAEQHWTGTVWNDGKGGAGGTSTATGTNGNTGASSYTVVAAGLTQFSPQVLVAKSAPLPVDFLRQSAECNGGDITVKWSTASEKNSDFFSVERSGDGANFTDIQHVLAAGTSTTVKNYLAVDPDPLQGVSYYRIRETDFNSLSMLSEVMTVNGCSNDEVFVYGTEGGIGVNITAIEEGPYNFELYDILGERLMNERKNVAAGENHLKLSVGNIASAMYVVKIYNASNSITKKVFIRSAYQQ